MAHPKTTDENLRLLGKATIAGFPVGSNLAEVPDNLPPGRMRGARGRAEAAERGALRGNGPHAGLLNPDRNVLITGIPFGTQVAELAERLRGFRLADSGMGIVKLPKYVVTVRV